MTPEIIRLIQKAALIDTVSHTAPKKQNAEALKAICEAEPQRQVIEVYKQPEVVTTKYTEEGNLIKSIQAEGTGGKVIRLQPAVKEIVFVLPDGDKNKRIKIDDPSIIEGIRQYLIGYSKDLQPKNKRGGQRKNGKKLLREAALLMMDLLEGEQETYKKIVIGEQIALYHPEWKKSNNHVYNVDNLFRNSHVKNP